MPDKQVNVAKNQSRTELSLYLRPIDVTHLKTSYLKRLTLRPVVADAVRLPKTEWCSFFLNIGLVSCSLHTDQTTQPQLLIRRPFSGHVFFQIVLPTIQSRNPSICVVPFLVLHHHTASTMIYITKATLNELSQSVLRLAAWPSQDLFSAARNKTVNKICRRRQIKEKWPGLLQGLGWTHQQQQWKSGELRSVWAEPFNPVPTELQMPPVIFHLCRVNQGKEALQVV